LKEEFHGRRKAVGLSEFRPCNECHLPLYAVHGFFYS